MKINFPSGVSQYTDINGNEWNADVNGQCDIGTLDPGPFIATGFTIPDQSSATRPTITQPGMHFFDPSLNGGTGRPIWRNASNTGWIDSTGASV